MKAHHRLRSQRTGKGWPARIINGARLTAENCGGSDLTTHAITIAGERWGVYLPLVQR